jgi:NAD(P)-dependent dehydrogenase (short-subunit alcohol dehydrogenase family)
VRELAGKVAVVTGAASGIGRATAELMAERGMRVVLSDIEQGPLDEAVAAIRDRGRDATGVVTDVTKWSSVERLRDEALAAYGKVNVAFLNAGVAGGGGAAIWDIDLKDWEWTIAVNVWGVIHGIRALVPPIIDAGEEGHVVITSSSVGVMAPVPSGAAYNLSKAADCSLA